MADTAPCLRVFEIFRSLQGETTRVGLPMWFVRLAGCDLACTWCDTPAARDPDAGRAMSLDEVLDVTAAPPLDWLTVTGGEPLLQVEAVNALVARCAARGQRVLVETSGAHLIDELHPWAYRILDVKAPGSGMADRMRPENLAALRPEDEVKLVLAGRDDYDWAAARLRAGDFPAGVAVLLAAAEGRLEAAVLARWMVEDGLGARLNVQIHKGLGLT